MGVVVHKGEIDGGHYYSFVKERPCVEKDDQDCRWWRFDDSSVEEWDVNRLDEDCFGGPKIEEDSVDRQRDSTDDLVKSRCAKHMWMVKERRERLITQFFSKLLVIAAWIIHLVCHFLAKQCSWQ